MSTLSALIGGFVRQHKRAYAISGLMLAGVATLSILVPRKSAADDSFSGRFVQKVLLDGRNPALADAMVRLMARDNNSLAAIGVLHLVGKGSVPELLRKRGLTVERIY